MIIILAILFLIVAFGLWAASDRISDLETRIYLLEEAYKIDLMERMKEKGISIGGIEDD